MNDKDQSARRKASGLNAKNVSDYLSIGKKDNYNNAMQSQMLRGSFKDTQQQDITQQREQQTNQVSKQTNQLQQHNANQMAQHTNQIQQQQQTNQHINEMQQLDQLNEDLESTKSFEIQRDDINEYFDYQSQKTSEIQRIRNEIQNLEKESNLYSSYDKSQNQRHSFPLQNGDYRSPFKNLSQVENQLFPLSTRNGKFVLSQNSNIENINQNNSEISNSVSLNGRVIQNKESLSKSLMKTQYKSIDGIAKQRGDYSSRNQDDSSRNHDDFYTRNQQDDDCSRIHNDIPSTRKNEDQCQIYQILQSLQQKQTINQKYSKEAVEQQKDEKIKQLEQVILTQNKFMEGFHNQQESYYAHLYADIKKQYEIFEEQTQKEKKEVEETISSLKKQLKISQEENQKKQKSLTKIVNYYNTLKTDYEKLLNKQQDQSVQQYSSSILNAYALYEIDPSNYSNNINVNHPNINNLSHCSNHNQHINTSIERKYLRQSKDNNSIEIQSKQNNIKEYQNINTQRDNNINIGINHHHHQQHYSNLDLQDDIRNSIDSDGHGPIKAFRAAKNNNNNNNNNIITSSSNFRNGNTSHQNIQVKDEQMRDSYQKSSLIKNSNMVGGMIISGGSTDLLSGGNTATSKQFNDVCQTNREGYEDQDEDINLVCEDDDILIRQSLQRDNKLFDNFFSPRSNNNNNNNYNALANHPNKLDSTSANSYEKVFKTEEKILEKQYWSTDYHNDLHHHNQNNPRENVEPFQAGSIIKQNTINHETQQQSEQSAKIKRHQIDEQEKRQQKLSLWNIQSSTKNDQQKEQQQQQKEQQQQQKEWQQQQKEQKQQQWLQQQQQQYQQNMDKTEQQMSSSSEHSLSVVNQAVKRHSTKSISPMKGQNKIANYSYEEEEECCEGNELVDENNISYIKQSSSQALQQNQLFQKALSNNKKQANPLFLSQNNDSVSVEVEIQNIQRNFRNSNNTNSFLYSSVEGLAMNIQSHQNMEGTQNQNMESQTYNNTMKIQDSFNKLLSKSYNKVTNVNSTKSNISTIETKSILNVNMTKDNKVKQYASESSTSSSQISAVAAPTTTQHMHPYKQQNTKQQTTKQQNLTIQSQKIEQSQNIELLQNLEQSSILEMKSNESKANKKSITISQSKICELEFQPSPKQTQKKKKHFPSQNEQQSINQTNSQPSSSAISFGGFFQNISNPQNQNQAKNNQIKSSSNLIKNNMSSQRQLLQSERKQSSEKPLFKKEKMKTEASEEIENQWILKQQLSQRQNSQGYSLNEQPITTTTTTTTQFTNTSSADLSNTFNFNLTDRNTSQKNHLSSASAATFNSSYSINNQANNNNVQPSNFNSNLKSSSYSQSSSHLKRSDGLLANQSNGNHMNINNNNNNNNNNNYNNINNNNTIQSSSNSTKQWLQNSYQLAQTKHQQIAPTSSYQMKGVYDNNYMNQISNNQSKNQQSQSHKTLNWQSEQVDGHDNSKQYNNQTQQHQFINLNKRLLSEKVNQIMECKKQTNNNYNSTNYNHSENIQNLNTSNNHQTTTTQPMILTPSSNKHQNQQQYQSYQQQQQDQQKQNNLGKFNQNISLQNAPSLSNHLYSSKQRFHTLEN